MSDLLTPKEIGDNLDLEIEETYPCSDGSVIMTISVDKLLEAQLAKAEKHYTKFMEQGYTRGRKDERKRIINWLKKYQTARRYSGRPFAEFRPPESEWQVLKGEE